MLSKLRHISNGETGTDQTIEIISNIVNESLKRPDVRLLAHRILREAGLSSRDGYKVASALTDWVRKHIRYVKDPIGVETVQSPEVTLKITSGDCDDHVVLISALMQSIGIPIRYVVVGRNRQQFSHIYIQGLIGSSWREIDTTIPGRIGRAGQLPVKKIYNNNGGRGMSGYVLNPGLAGSPEVVPVRRSTLSKAAYMSAINVLQKNWNSGIIDKTDLDSSIRVINEGNSPSYGTILEAPIKKAIEDFRNMVTAKRIASVKPSGSFGGVGGLEGLLSTVWDGVKKSSQTVIDTGVQYIGSLLKRSGGASPLVIGPSAQPFPLQREAVTSGERYPAPATAGVMDIFKSPAFIVLAGVALIWYFRPK